MHEDMAFNSIHIYLYNYIASHHCMVGAKTTLD